MSIHPYLNVNTPRPATHVIVLTAGAEPDLLGIWGPYPNEQTAQWAIDELTQWPIDGAWEIVRLKNFPVPASFDSAVRDATSSAWNGGTRNV